jgi:hypothetical protein
VGGQEAEVEDNSHSSIFGRQPSKRVPCALVIRLRSKASLCRALGRIHVMVSGFPCQDLSRANKKGQGLRGPSSSLFFLAAQVGASLPLTMLPFGWCRAEQSAILRICRFLSGCGRPAPTSSSCLKMVSAAPTAPAGQQVVAALHEVG